MAWLRQLGCGASRFIRRLVVHGVHQQLTLREQNLVQDQLVWGAGKNRDLGTRTWAGNMGWERASAFEPSMRLPHRPRPHDRLALRRGDRSGCLSQVRRGPFQTNAPDCKAPSKTSALQYLHLHRPIKTAFWAPHSAPGAAGAQLHLHRSTCYTCTCTCCCCCSLCCWSWSVSYTHLTLPTRNCV